MATAKKSSKNETSTSTKAAKQTPGTSSKSMPANGKDPNGGLTAAGRAFYKKKEGANLKPGVTGPHRYARKTEAQGFLPDPSFHQPSRDPC